VALEEMVKLGQMERATFEALRDEIVGGDVRNVHLVKGLDYKLLERVRRGEDVLAEKGGEKEEEVGEEVVDEAEVDDALDDLAGREVKPLEKERKAKKGEMAPPPPVAGKKRTRDEILAELKASRVRAAEEKKAAQQPSLGPKFKTVGSKREQSRIERDERGREVLITVDDEGNVKRKVKKAKVDDELAARPVNGLLVPDHKAKPLGMEIPETKASAPPVEDEVMDIFEGVGNDYDPLSGGVADDDDSSSGSDAEMTPKQRSKTEDAATAAAPGQQPPEMPPPPPPMAHARNYFGDIAPTTAETAPANPLADPSILAALKKASTIVPAAEASSEAEALKAARRKKMLEGDDRDAQDMDLGFGGSRLEDGEDGEDKAVKLSVWSGRGLKGGDDEEEGERKGGKGGKDGKDGKKRKRGGGKRKGDKDSAVDVLRVIERRKAEAK
jgi:hypothetical protein